MGLFGFGKSKKERKKEKTKDRVNLRISEAYTKDYYHKVARIDRDLWNTLNVSKGDVIEIKGKRRTFAKCFPLVMHDEFQGIIRIDEQDRNNTKTIIGDNLSIKKIETTVALKVNLKQMGGPPNIDEEFLVNSFEGIPIMIGDELVTYIQGSKSFSFCILGITVGATDVYTLANPLLERPPNNIASVISPNTKFCIVEGKPEEKIETTEEKKLDQMGPMGTMHIQLTESEYNEFNQKTRDHWTGWTICCAIDNLHTVLIDYVLDEFKKKYDIELTSDIALHRVRDACGVAKIGLSTLLMEIDINLTAIAQDPISPGNRFDFKLRITRAKLDELKKLSESEDYVEKELQETRVATSFHLQILSDYVVDEFMKDFDLKSDLEVIYKIAQVCEKAQIELSTVMETDIDLSFIAHDPFVDPKTRIRSFRKTGAKNLKLRITRAKLDELKKNHERKYHPTVKIN